MLDESIKNLLNDFSLEGSSSAEAISELNKLHLPDDYIEVISEINGGEGFINNEYLILWKPEELLEFNKEYEVEQYAPGIFLFGSNGGGEGFAFDTRTTPYKVVQIPFIGMDLSCASCVADSFLDLLKKMEVSDGSLL
jgi:hypothetical protein